MGGELLSKEYFVLSLKWSKGQELLVWWRPNNAGYTCRLDDAGRYTAEAIEADRRYYDDGEGTLAVPCEMAESLAIRVVTDESLHKIKSADLRFRQEECD
jgi:hypothetical protein